MKKILTDIVEDAVNLGFCYGSALRREISGMFRGLLGPMERMIGRSSQIGARTPVDAAVVQGQVGKRKHLSDNQVKP